MLQRDGNSAALAQFCDSHNYAQTLMFLNVHPPSEILISATAVDSDLCKILAREFGASSNIVQVQRKLFSESKGSYFR